MMLPSANPRVADLAAGRQTAAKADAGDDCAQVAVMATRYRLDHGSLPARLDDLIPNYLDEIPLDSFDAHPLRLVVKNAQWIIYSVGPDGVDNGGVSIDLTPNTGRGISLRTLRFISSGDTTRQGRVLLISLPITGSRLTR
jgi:hypothetical protein